MSSLLKDINSKNARTPNSSFKIVEGQKAYCYHSLMRNNIK